MPQPAFPAIFDRGVSPAARLQQPNVVRLQGDYDIATVATLWETLTAAIATSDDVLVVDLGGAEFVDASTIGVLVRTEHLLASQGRSLAVRAPSNLVRRLLDICGLTALLERGPSLVAPATDPEGEAPPRATPDTGAAVGPGTVPGAPPPWVRIRQADPATTRSGAEAVARSRFSQVRR